MNKTCTKCHETKPLDDFYNHKKGKNGKMSYCKECTIKKTGKYAQEHREEGEEYHRKYNQEHRDEAREKAGQISMYENKSCSKYLGIVIAERLIRHLFKDVKVMPHNNIGFDFICNKGKKIDVKSGCIQLNNGKYPKWVFKINRNTIADFFICVAFDNRTDLNPLHLWMIPGSELNQKRKTSISLSRIHKWDKWKKDIKDAQLCCAEIKEANHEI